MLEEGALVFQNCKPPTQTKMRRACPSSFLPPKIQNARGDDLLSVNPIFFSRTSLAVKYSLPVSGQYSSEYAQASDFDDCFFARFPRSEALTISGKKKLTVSENTSH